MPKQTTCHNTSIPQVMEEEDSEQVFYYVQQILDRRTTSKQTLYLIKWKNYPQPKDFTWQPLRNLQAVIDMVQQFNTRFQQKAKSKNQQQAAKVNKHKKNQPKQKQKMNLTNDSSRSLIKDKNTSQTAKRNKTNLIDIGKTLQYNDQSQAKVSQKTKTYQDQSNHQERWREASTSQIQISKKVTKNTKQPEDWRKLQLKLGQIHQYFLQGQDVYFNINLINTNNKLCDMISLSLDQILNEDKQKLAKYLQSHFKQIIVRHQQLNSECLKSFQDYWKSFS